MKNADLVTLKSFQFQKLYGNTIASGKQTMFWNRIGQS